MEKDGLLKRNFNLLSIGLQWTMYRPSWCCTESFKCKLVKVTSQEELLFWCLLSLRGLSKLFCFLSSCLRLGNWHLIYYVEISKIKLQCERFRWQFGTEGNLLPVKDGDCVLYVGEENTYLKWSIFMLPWLHSTKLCQKSRLEATTFSTGT